MGFVFRDYLACNYIMNLKWVLIIIILIGLLIYIGFAQPGIQIVPTVQLGGGSDCPLEYANLKKEDGVWQLSIKKTANSEPEEKK